MTSSLLGSTLTHFGSTTTTNNGNHFPPIFLNCILRHQNKSEEFPISVLVDTGSGMSYIGEHCLAGQCAPLIELTTPVVVTLANEEPIMIKSFTNLAVQLDDIEGKSLHFADCRFYVLPNTKLSVVGRDLINTMGIIFEGTSKLKITDRTICEIPMSQTQTIDWRKDPTAPRWVAHMWHSHGQVQKDQTEGSNNAEPGTDRQVRNLHRNYVHSTMRQSKYWYVMGTQPALMKWKDNTLLVCVRSLT
jgi:hypothetical protein